MGSHGSQANPLIQFGMTYFLNLTSLLENMHRKDVCRGRKMNWKLVVAFFMSVLAQQHRQYEMASGNLIWSLRRGSFANSALYAFSICEAVHHVVQSSRLTKRRKHSTLAAAWSHQHCCQDGYIVDSLLSHSQ